MKFLGFLIAGGIAAAVNILARLWLERWMTYEWAVAAAFPIALTVAFALNKFLVFKSSGKVLGEYTRFTLVNLFAFVQVWIVSVGLARFVFPFFNFTWNADLVAHVIGVASPVVTSFYAHRQFSFRAQ